MHIRSASMKALTTSDSSKGGGRRRGVQNKPSEVLEAPGDIG